VVKRRIHKRVFSSQGSIGRARAIVRNSTDFQQLMNQLNAQVSAGQNHPKLFRLQQILNDHFDIAEFPDSRAIVFAQYKETVMLITERLNQAQGK
jgi:ERCC4-related helicase